jgi:hypothetical protein
MARFTFSISTGVLSLDTRLELERRLYLTKQGVSGLKCGPIFNPVASLELSL